MSTEKNKILQDLVARIDATLKKRNSDRFRAFDEPRQLFREKLAAQGYNYFKMLADLALIEGFISTEWYCEEQTNYSEFLVNVLRVIKKLGHKKAIDQYEGTLEQMMMDLFDGIACIVAKRKEDGQIDFNNEDVYEVFEQECDSFDFEPKPEGNQLSYSEIAGIDKKLDFYSVSAFYNYLRFVAYFCEKYVAAK